MSKKHLTLKKLNGSNLTDVMSLQDRIIANLSKDEQHFILHRTENDYMKSLNGKNSHMIGVFDDDILIAQIIYSLPKNGETRDMPEYKQDIPNNNLVIYKAILVDPEYRGSSLMKKMLEYIEENAIDKDRTTSIIQIAIDNPASWINALHHGMNITKVDNDPTDGVKVIYLEKNINSTNSFQQILDYNQTYSLYLGNNIHQKIPALFNKMKHLINKGYQGITLDKETKSLIWKKNYICKRKFFTKNKPTHYQNVADL